MGYDTLEVGLSPGRVEADRRDGGGISGDSVKSLGWVLMGSPSDICRKMDYWLKITCSTLTCSTSRLPKPQSDGIDGHHRPRKRASKAPRPNRAVMRSPVRLNWAV